MVLHLLLLVLIARYRENVQKVVPRSLVALLKLLALLASVWVSGEGFPCKLEFPLTSAIEPLEAEAWMSIIPKQCGRCVGRQRNLPARQVSPMEYPIWQLFVNVFVVIGMPSIPHGDRRPYRRPSISLKISMCRGQKFQSRSSFWGNPVSDGIQY